MAGFRGPATTLSRFLVCLQSSAVVLGLLAILDVSVRGHQAGTRVSGRVIDALTAAPIPTAVVTAHVTGQGGHGTRAMTTVDGAFVLDLVGTGPFLILATKDGYVGGEYGQVLTGSSGVPFHPSGAGSVEAVTLRLWRTGVIAGAVVDERGEAVVDAPVVALRWGVRGGAYDMDVIRPRDGRTDDRGQFRLRALRPGRYSVAVEANRDDGQSEVFYTTYAPGTPLVAGAAAFDLTAGAVIDGVSIVLDRSQGAAIMGTTLPLQELRRPEVWLLPMPTGEVRSPLPLGRTRVDAVGRFRFRQVPRGSYYVRVVDFPTAAAGAPTQLDGGRRVVFPELQQVSAVAPTGSTLWGETPVLHDRGETVVTVDLVTGARIKGSLVQLGASARSPSTESFLAVSPADGRSLGPGSAPLARVGPDGDFETVGLPPGRYGLALFDLSGTAIAADRWIESVRLHGAAHSGAWLDVGQTDVAGVEVHVASRADGGVLRGTVRDENGQPSAAATVYVFPVDRESWRGGYVDEQRFRAVQPTSLDGSYTVRDLPPGDYQAIAFLGGAREGWRLAASLLEMSARARKLTVRHGDTVTQPLVAVR